MLFLSPSFLGTLWSVLWFLSTVPELRIQPCLWEGGEGQGDGLASLIPWENSGFSAFPAKPTSSMVLEQYLLPQRGVSQRVLGLGGIACLFCCQLLPWVFLCQCHLGEMLPWRNVMCWEEKRL